MIVRELKRTEKARITLDNRNYLKKKSRRIGNVEGRSLGDYGSLNFWPFAICD